MMARTVDRADRGTDIATSAPAGDADPDAKVWILGGTHLPDPVFTIHSFVKPGGMRAWAPTVFPADIEILP